MIKRFAALALTASLALDATRGAGAAPVPVLSSKTPVFTAGHWLGKGWFTGTQSNATASGMSDGAFTFDLTVGVSGLVTGRMMMSTTGTVSNDAAVATFTETSDGTGWVLTGNGASIDWDGSEGVTGTMVGRRNGMSVPLPISPHFHAYGHFEPVHATCGTASGDISLPLEKAFAGGSSAGKTTVYGPWVAVKVGGSDGLHDPFDEVEGWLTTISEMDAAADKDFKGMTAAQLHSLIVRSQQVEAAIAGWKKCGSGMSDLHSKAAKDMFAIFGLEIASARQAYANIGGHF